MAQPFFEDYFQDDYHKFNRDEPASVTIDITVDGETRTISISVEDLSSVLQPALKQSFGPVGKYRRVPKTVLPKIEMMTASRYIGESNCGPIRKIVDLLSDNAGTEVLPLVDKLQQAKMEGVALGLSEYCSDVGTVAQLMEAALEGEFNKGKTEKGSIMRGSSFAVQVAKLFVMGPEFSEYRKNVLMGIIEDICKGQDSDLGASFRRVIEAITCDSAVEKMPIALRHVCDCLSRLSDSIGLTPDERDGQVAGLIMLRFFNPAIISPAAHGLNVEPGASAMNHLKDLTRVLQKFSTGQAYSEESMASTQKLMNEMYPEFRKYLQNIGKAMDQVEKKADATPSVRCCQLVFDALFSVQDYVKSKGWNEVENLICDMRYVVKLQAFLQSEASYLSQLEKIEESLRKVSAGTIATGDPFEVVYQALKSLSTWHVSMFYLLFDRLDSEWSYHGSAQDWLHLIVLEFEQVYEPYTNCFLFAFRNLIDISRDLAATGDTSETADLNESIIALLPLMGRPLKRFGEILAFVSDVRLPAGHVDQKCVDMLMNRGKEVFNLLRGEVNVSTVLEMGQIELQFEEKLNLLKTGRSIVRHGNLQDEKGNSLEMWLFSDMILCGAIIPGKKVYRKVVMSSLLSLSTRPVPGDDCSFVMSVMAVDDGNTAPSPGRDGLGAGHKDSIGGQGDALGMGGASAASSMRSKRLSTTMRHMNETRLTCTSVKQKGMWLSDILGLQETLHSNVRLSRSSQARQQLPDMSSLEWDKVMEGSEEQKFEENTFVLTAGSVNTRLYRIKSGRLLLRKGKVELVKLGVGDVFGWGSLLTGNEQCLCDVAVQAGGATLVAVEATKLTAGTGSKELLRHLLKSGTKSTENLLRKVRLRFAANRVLLSKQEKKLIGQEVAEIVTQAFVECESVTSGGGGYSKLDVADIIMGSDPKDFVNPNIEMVFPKLTTLKCYGSGLGTMFSKRGHWTAAMLVLEGEKRITNSKDGYPVLTKKGKDLSFSGMDPDAIKSGAESFFGQKGECVLGQFSVQTAKHMDRLFLSDNYLCLTGGRVLGLGHEKKQLIHILNVAVCDVKKKVLDLVFVISIQQAPLKITFKTTAEANFVFNFIKGKLKLKPVSKTYDKFSSVKFAPNVPISAADAPNCYVLDVVGMVNVVSKMAAGDLVLHSMSKGSLFVVDSAFFGLPDDTKLALVSDPNVEVSAREVTLASLAQSPELSISVLGDLLTGQLDEVAKYLSKM